MKTARELTKAERAMLQKTHFPRTIPLGNYAYFLKSLIVWLLVPSFVLGLLFFVVAYFGHHQPIVTSVEIGLLPIGSLLTVGLLVFLLGVRATLKSSKQDKLLKQDLEKEKVHIKSHNIRSVWYLVDTDNHDKPDLLFQLTNGDWINIPQIYFEQNFLPRETLHIHFLPESDIVVTVTSSGASVVPPSKAIVTNNIFRNDDLPHVSLFKISDMPIEMEQQLKSNT